MVSLETASWQLLVRNSWRTSATISQNGLRQATLLLDVSFRTAGDSASCLGPDF